MISCLQSINYCVDAVFNYSTSAEFDEVSMTTILPLPFVVLKYFGWWRPKEWTNRWEIIVYHSFTAIVSVAMYTFTASQLVELIVYFFKYQEIPETLYLFLATTAACYKAAVLLFKKENVIYLGKMLLHDRCIPRDVEEHAIQKRYNNISRFVQGTCITLVCSNILLIALAPLLQMSNRRHLPYETWLPYGIEDPCNYWLSYMHQILALLCCGAISATIDNIVTGFMLQACAQFSILKHRLNALPAYVRCFRSKKSRNEADRLEKIMLSQYVQHHDYIYNYAEILTKTFSSIIFVQFCASAVIITVSVYQLSTINAINLDFIKVSLYLVTMLIEFLMYCWFGNEVHVKSIEFAENVYHTNWMTLNLESWKMMLFMIHRSSKPIIISCYKVVYLSLSIYVQILKLSYSAYNVLRKTNFN